MLTANPTGASSKTVWMAFSWPLRTSTIQSVSNRYRLIASLRDDWQSAAELCIRFKRLSVDVLPTASGFQNPIFGFGNFLRRKDCAFLFHLLQSVKLTIFLQEDWSGRCISQEFGKAATLCHCYFLYWFVCHVISPP